MTNEYYLKEDLLSENGLDCDDEDLAHIPTHTFPKTAKPSEEEIYNAITMTIFNRGLIDHLAVEEIIQKLAKAIAERLGK